MKFQKIIFPLLFLLALASSASAQRRQKPNKQLEKAPAENHVMLSDNNGEYQHTHYLNTPWGNPGGASELVFAPESDVNPDSTCAPSLAEIALWNSLEPTEHEDAIVYYNCTDDSTVTATYVYYIDTGLVVTLLESPHEAYSTTRRIIPSPAFAVPEAPTEAEVWAYIQILSPPPKPGTMFYQSTGAIPMAQNADNPSAIWFYDGLHVTRIKDFPRKVEIPDNAFADTLNQTVLEVYTWLGVDTTFKGNYWLLYNVGAGTKDNPDWVYSSNGDYNVSNNDIVCIKKPGSSGNGGTVFTTTSPTNSTLTPNTTPKNGDVLFNKVLGSEWQRVAGSWVRIKNDNGFNVLNDFKVTVPSPSDAIYRPNLNLGNRQYLATDDTDGAFINGADFISSQSNGEVFILEIENTAGDDVAMYFDTLTFKNKVAGGVALEALDYVLLSAGEHIAIPLQIVYLGEIVVLQTMADWNRGAGGGGGGANLTFSGSSSPVSLNSDLGTDVTFTAGTNITFSQTGNNLTINSTASGGGLTGITEQVNGIDLAAGGGNLTVDYDFNELTLDNTYSASDVFLRYDAGLAAYVKMNPTYFAGGFVDLTSNQVNIAGTKGFTTGLQFGATAMPTGINFGSSVQTPFALKAGTTNFLAESVWQDFGGYLVENYKDGGTGNFTTRFILTGDDAGGGHVHKAEFWARPAGSSQNVVKTAEWTASQWRFGNSSFFSNGAGGGVISVPIGGIGFDGGNSNYTLTPVSAAGLNLLENGNTNTFLAVGINGWQVASDSTLKYDITRVTMTPDKIRRLKAYTYRLISSDSLQLGVIAQEIQQDFPEAVTVDSAGKLAVNMLSIAALGLEAANQLQAQLDAPRDSTMTESSGSTANARKFAILPVDASGGTVTVTPPAGPYTVGDWFAIADSRASAGSNNITVDFTTDTIKLNGSVANATISTNGAFVRYTYMGSGPGFVRSN